VSLRYLALLILAQSLFGSARAGAEPQPTASDQVRPVTAAIIGTSPIHQEFVPLVRAELAELGVEVVEEPEDSTTAFTFRILIKPTSLEVWILDRRTGQLALREVFTQSDGRALEARTAALHAVELLRWHLTDVQPRLRPRPSPPTGEEVPERATVESRQPARRREFGLGFAPTLRFAPGGFGHGISGQLDTSFRSGVLGLRAMATTTLREHSLERAEGRAEARSQSLAVEALLVLPAEPTRLSVSLGAGFALVSTELRGVAASGYLAEDDQLLTAAPLLDGRLHLRLLPMLQAILGASLLVPLRSSEVVFEQRTVATYGRWHLSLAAGLEFVLDVDVPKP